MISYILIENNISISLHINTSVDSLLLPVVGSLPQTRSSSAAIRTKDQEEEEEEEQTTTYQEEEEGEGEGIR